ncbi:hypothetical protein N2152v2_007423 [Parachlorella kessleri]
MDSVSASRVAESDKPGAKTRRGTQPGLLSGDDSACVATKERAVEHMAQPGFSAADVDNANKYAFVKPPAGDTSLAKIPPEGLKIPVHISRDALVVDRQGSTAPHAATYYITVTPLRVGSPAPGKTVLGKRKEGDQEEQVAGLTAKVRELSTR